MQGSTLAKRVWLLAFLAIVACYFFGLGDAALLGPDEPRYAQVAREMFARGDPITPTLGGHTWFEKPSLLYWMMMAAYGAFGVSEFAARLGPAFAGLVTILAIFWMGRRVERAATAREKPSGLGQWSSLALASCGGMIVFSRGASFDIIVTMTITLALASFFVSEIEGEKRRRLILLAGFYAAIGASLLAKGLVGLVIPFGVVGAYSLFSRRWPDRVLRISLLWGVPLALVIASVWYGPVIARHGWLFIDDFFIQHHFARYVSNKYLHPQPFWFYIPVMLFLAFPWCAFLIAALVATRRWEWRATDPSNKFRVFTLAWLVVPVAFFSLSGSKLPGYVLPALPAAMLLTGEYLVQFVRGEGGKTAIRVTGMLLIGLAVGVCLYVPSVHAISNTRTFLVVAPLTVGGTLAWILGGRRRLAVLMVFAAMLMSSVIAVACVSEFIGERGSVRHLLQTAAARGYGSAPVYGLHTIEQTAEFYAPGRVARAENGKPFRFEGPQQLLSVTRGREGWVLVFVPVEYLSQLNEYAPLEKEFIGDNGSVALVAVRSR